MAQLRRLDFPRCDLFTCYFPPMLHDQPYCCIVPFAHLLHWFLCFCLYSISFHFISLLLISSFALIIHCISSSFVHCIVINWFEKNNLKVSPQHSSLLCRSVFDEPERTCVCASPPSDCFRVEPTHFSFLLPHLCTTACRQFAPSFGDVEYLRILLINPL